MKAVVSEKGQVTIPKRLRDRLGLRAGQVLEFREDKGKLVVTKETRDPVGAVYGIVKIGSTNAYVTALRGEVDGA